MRGGRTKRNEVKEKGVNMFVLFCLYYYCIIIILE